MNDIGIHVRIPKQLKKAMEQLVKKGLYINESDLVREALREKVGKAEVKA